MDEFYPVLQILLSFINILIIPVLVYVIKMERRIAILETQVNTHDKHAQRYLDLLEKVFKNGTLNMP